MKKIISLICLITIVLSMTLTAFAGDVPEGLLSNDEAQVFFGEMLSYSDNEDNPHISVCPVKKIKGDVLTGTKQHYDRANPVGDIDIKPGNVYLITYFDENNPTNIFEVTSYDTSTLKLKNVEGDMWERFEQYLNDGKYEKAEQDRINKINATLTEVGDEITLAALLEVGRENCDKIELQVTGGNYEVDRDEFYKLADEIRLTDVENTLVVDINDSLLIQAYEGDEIHTVNMWDNSRVSGSRVAMNSAPIGDYIMKAEDYSRLIKLLPKEAQPKLPPLKSLYANFINWFIWNPTTVYMIGALIIVVLVAVIGVTIGYKIKKKRK